MVGFAAGSRSAFSGSLQAGETTVIRWLLAGTICVLLAAGCGDTRRPSIRGEVTEPEPRPADGAEDGDLSHHTAHGGQLPEALGPKVDLDTVYLTAPKSWTRKQPRSGFVLAEFGLPRAEGDAVDGRLTVTAVGGSVEANVSRWRQQFGGKPEHQSQEEVEIAGVRVTMIEFAGTFSDQHGGLAAGVRSADYRMWGAIFEIGGRQYIVKCYGPEKTMAGRHDEFLAFMRSLKSTQPDSTGQESAGEKDAAPDAAEREDAKPDRPPGSFR